MYFSSKHKKTEGRFSTVGTYLFLLLVGGPAYNLTITKLKLFYFGTLYFHWESAMYSRVLGTPVL